MDTLYISDLDGTLLDVNVEVSERTYKILNELISSGMRFSVATARTAASVRKILENVNIEIPVILMNGVCEYDLKNDRYTSIESISEEGKKYLIKTVKKHFKTGFLYTIDNGKLSTYYESCDSPSAVKFIEERKRKYNKVFTPTSSFYEQIENNIVYFSVDDKKETLQPAYEELIKCPDLHIEFYRDIYLEDHWYLEICSAGASKKNAVLKLKKSLGVNKVISFGDNLNDLPMFEISDECYAVENAKDEVKNRATAVIGNNTNDGVAEYLKKIYKPEV